MRYVLLATEEQSVPDAALPQLKKAKKGLSANRPGIVSFETIRSGADPKTPMFRRDTQESNLRPSAPEGIYSSDFAALFTTNRLEESSSIHGDAPCATVTQAGETFARLRGLARGLVSLAELGDVEAALAVLNQLQGVLVGMRPRRDDLPTRYDRILENDE